VITHANIKSTAQPAYSRPSAVGFVLNSAHFSDCAACPANAGSLSPNPNPKTPAPRVMNHLLRLDVEKCDLAIKGSRLRSNLLHQLGRTKARICAHQQRRGHQSGGLSAPHQLLFGVAFAHALAQRRARWDHAQSECAHEKGDAPKALGGIKVAVAQKQQGQIGCEDVAVGRTRAHGELRIDQGVEVNALEVFADKGQSGVGAEVLGQFFDHKFVHVWTHLLGEQYMRSKLMILIGKLTYFYCQVKDSGIDKIDQVDIVITIKITSSPHSS